MGKVFSWKEIEAGGVPKLKNFSDFKRIVRARIEREEMFLGGTFCGSVHRCDWNERSDFDCFVVYDPEWLNDSIFVLRELNCIAEELHIPAELIFVAKDVAASRFHHVFHAFYNHLKWAVAEGGVIKCDPLPFISMAHLDYVVDTLRYFEKRLNSLEKLSIETYGPDSQGFYDFLERSLDTPAKIARMLALEEEKYDSGSKYSALELYFENAPKEEAKLTREIIMLDGAYSLLLEKQLRFPCEISYQDGIAELAMKLGNKAIELTRLAGFRFASMHK